MRRFEVEKEEVKQEEKKRRGVVWEYKEQNYYLLTYHTLSFLPLG
jgi:hypothetical protein